MGKCCSKEGDKKVREMELVREMDKGMEEEDVSDEGMHAYEGTALDGVDLQEEETFAPLDMSEKEDPMDEMIEVDEAMLVQELRRARRLMNESRKRNARKKQKLQEMQLKGIIDQEVKNVLKELQLNSSWVYGKNKPTRSRKGYVHQGNFLKGIGFK